MTLTRQTFQLIADTLKEERPVEGTDYAAMTAWQKGAYDSWHTTCLAFADSLVRTNAQFDRTRFLKACGFEASQIAA